MTLATVVRNERGVLGARRRCQEGEVGAMRGLNASTRARAGGEGGY